MAIPAITFQIAINGISTQQPAVGQVLLVMGMATSGPCTGQTGVPTPLISVGTEAIVSSTYGSGPLPELVNGLLEAGASQVIACRIFSGSISGTTTTHTGTGTGTITWSGSPMGPYGAFVSSGVTAGPIVKITTASGAGAGVFAYSLDGGNTYSAPITIPGTPFQVILLNTGITLTFSAAIGAGVWVLNDTYKASITAAAGTVGTTAQQNLVSGTAQGLGNVVASSAAAGPADQYEIIVQIITQGSIPATAGQNIATFQYSLDGGNTFSNTLAIPSSNTYVVGEAGEITLTFSNTGGTGAGTGFQPNDRYLINCTGPYYTTTDLNNVMAQVSASALQFGMIHLTGRPTSAANAATVAAAVDAQMTSMASTNRFVRCLMEMPANISGNGDAASIASFTGISLPSLRVALGNGDINFQTPDGYQLQRCCSWSAAAVCALVRPGQDLGWVGAGGIADAVDILRDESQLQNLDSLGFITTRTWKGKQGYFFTSAQIMGAIGTNFQYLVFGRVMDECLTAAYGALLPYVNQGLLANPATGFIDPRQAAEVDNDVTVAMYNAAVVPGDCSGVSCSVSLTANIAATGILPVTITVVGNLYGRQITVSAGFALKLANI
jgi:uncharacterized protein DUF2586